MKALTVGLITTWNAKCGVSEYSRDLAASLRAAGCEVIVLASYPVRQVSWATDDPQVYRFFHTGWEKERGVDTDLALNAIRRHRVEVLHLQYQSFIYAPPFLEQLPRLAEAAPLVVTFHDPCIPREFPMACIRQSIVHNHVLAEVVRSVPVQIIPPGCHLRPDRPSPAVRAGLGLAGDPVVTSFGLGRAAHELVLEAVSGLLDRYPHLTYAIAAPSERMPPVYAAARRLGLESHLAYMGDFLPPDRLFDLLDAGDVVVLYYPEFGSRGVSSAAARLAVAAHRPVVLTDVLLFEDLPAELKVPFGDLAALEERLHALLSSSKERARALGLQRQLVRENAWPAVALHHIDVYRAAA